MDIVQRALQWLLIIATPAALTLASVRVVAQPWFIDFEYRRPGFPPDLYGFTQEDRQAYGYFALEYLLYGKEVAYLSERAFPDGAPMFNARELRHMEDVQAATQGAFAAHTALLAAMAAVAAYLAWSPARRPALKRALFGGGLLTLGLLLALLALVLLNWNHFFNLFHQLFFESGTWRFYVDDTLIRLYPEQFWFDAALAVGALTALGAALLVIVGRWWQPRAGRAASR
ncbi:MAG: DUF1461 domain-containing protein [Anaerolineae bacterium]|nr:DUF1461 domain-containing protein [Anaerolineae bacterium]